MIYAIQNTTHQCLEGCWPACHSEGHPSEFEGALVTDKCRLGDILFAHCDLEKAM